MHAFSMCGLHEIGPVQATNTSHTGSLFSEHNHTPKWKENGDWSAGDNYIPSAKYWV